MKPITVNHQKNKGILVVAHGSRNSRWVEFIEQSISNLEINIPITVGYLELVEGRSISDGVRRLEKQDVEQIYVIPFFVSSGSTHLDEIKYSLGVTEEPILETDLPLVHPQAEIIWGNAMDDHPLILEVLQERIKELSKNPKEESLLLVAHGSDRAYFQPFWEETLQKMVDHFTTIFGFSKAGFGTILPPTISTEATKLSDNGGKNIVAVPVFLSEGFYTSKKIPEKLEGIPHFYNGKSYLPHPLVSSWLQAEVDSFV
ncbi:sirohydrochlorin chelatase [Evansella sp. AB-rgal1]|uniref:sirohydrochlorin chelatase n=1 Tax=Evansella sp. AB-rgal1 TaxID=3242696 RepID=UPI00359EBA59